MSVLVSLVLYNSEKTHGINALRTAVQSVLDQTGYQLDKNLTFNIYDNNSSDEGFQKLKEYFSVYQINFIKLACNIGFTGAHNLAAKDFFESNKEYFLIINPDLKLETSAINELVKAINLNSEIGMATPCLLRADQNLNPVEPRLIDAAGMYITKSLRHFDRGSNKKYDNTYNNFEYVFGGTGACLLIKKNCLKSLIIKGEKYDHDLAKIYPNEYKLIKDGLYLFDPAFFAYREDADLAWRAQLLGWKCIYVPTAIASHKRVVLVTNRSKVSKEINALSVRNRFLMQINNWRFLSYPCTIIPGFIIRNVFVIFAVLIYEPSSAKSLVEVVKLYRRAKERRGLLFKKINTNAHAKVNFWFNHQCLEIK